MSSALDMWSIEMVKGHSWGDRCQLYQVVVSDEIEMLNHQCVSDSGNQRRSVKRRRRQRVKVRVLEKWFGKEVWRRAFRREDEEESPQEGGRSV